MGADERVVETGSRARTSARLWRATVLRVTLILAIFQCLSCSRESSTEQIAFASGLFHIVGELRLPEGGGRHPAVVFVHGDGPNDRTAGGSYLPIMERMLAAGYATFAWDKPGTGESLGEIDQSRLLEQRAQIVLDALAVLQEHRNIDARRIGLWGISQAGYVMPKVLERSQDVAFMIAVSCPGVPGVEQGAYLVAAQAACGGLPEDDAKQVAYLLSQIEQAQSYEQYLDYKARLDTFPMHDTMEELGFTMRTVPETEWHLHDQENDYFWDPMQVVERTSIPVLVFFGEKDTQVDPIQGAEAYRVALRRAGNQNYRVELIPGTDHNIILSRTGCLRERNRRPPLGWKNYPDEYLDLLEMWLKNLVL